MAAAAALPGDLLASVFGCLPARSLVASRGVCKAWRDLIDEHQLLVRLQRLLPHTVRGLFIKYQDCDRPHFLSRPTPTSSPEYGGRIDGKFDFIELVEPGYFCYEVVDHCNGHILFLDCDAAVLHVCNPTTRWSALLPPFHTGDAFCYDAWYWGNRAFLVFDPFVSLEYKVLLSPAEPGETQMARDDACSQMEWPPSAWTTWHEFSSSTGRWEEKKFVREGEAAGTAGDLLQYKNHWGVEPPCRYAAYWKGALYLHCRGNFVSRLSLLDNKYRVIKSPLQLAECKNPCAQYFLGRSEKGVYIAAIPRKDLSILRVWTLNESFGHTEWVLKDQVNLKINASSWWLENNNFDEQKYWKLDDDDERKNQDVSLVDHNICWKVYDDNIDNPRKNQDVLPEQSVCWNSDDDNIVNISYDEQDYVPYAKFLGFHPYKEVIFLSCNRNAVAFHLNSPQVQYLGRVALSTENRGISECFVYTPCLI